MPALATLGNRASYTARSSFGAVNALTFTMDPLMGVDQRWLMLQVKARRGFTVSHVESSHILNSIPTVIYVLAVTAKGFPSQWVSDSVKKSWVTKSRKPWPMTGGSTVCIPMTRKWLLKKRRS